MRQALDAKGELVAGGHRYYVRNTKRGAYPVVGTVTRLAAASKASVIALVGQLATVSSGKLDAHIKTLAKEMPKSDVYLLRLEPDAAAECSYVPQIWKQSRMNRKEQQEMGKFSVNKGK